MRLTKFFPKFLRRNLRAAPRREAEAAAWETRGRREFTQPHPPQPVPFSEKPSPGPLSLSARLPWLVSALLGAAPETLLGMARPLRQTILLASGAPPLVWARGRREVVCCPRGLRL